MARKAPGGASETNKAKVVYYLSSYIGILHLSSRELLIKLRFVFFFSIARETKIFPNKIS